MDHRLAGIEDLPALRSLMELSIRQLMKDGLNEEQIEAAFEFMGVDRQLIDDGTYFVIEIDGRLAGCGGWSRRATLYGGDHTAGRDARLLDPEKEAARIRAMYTHPDFARRGVGRKIIELCECAAAAEGFTQMELGATVTGLPLYTACGFTVIEQVDATSSNGVRFPITRMGKMIPPLSTA